MACRGTYLALIAASTNRAAIAALEAQALGRGGVSLMARITGLARSTIYHGLSDIRERASAPPGRIRKEGGGRKKKSVQDPSLLADLKELVEPATGVIRRSCCCGRAAACVIL